MAQAAVQPAVQPGALLFLPHMDISNDEQAVAALYIRRAGDLSGKDLLCQHPAGHQKGAHDGTKDTEHHDLLQIEFRGRLGNALINAEHNRKHSHGRQDRSPFLQIQKNHAGKINIRIGMDGLTLHKHSSSESGIVYGPVIIT